MVGRSDFENSTNPHVMEPDQDPDDPELIPLVEYDYSAEWADLAERVKKDEENRFDCPRCGEEQTGYPDACDNCNAEYTW